MNNRLIVGFDGSETSMTALRWAAAVAESRGASIRVVASYSMPPVMDIYGLGAVTATAAERRKLRDAHMAGITVAVDDLRHNHPTVGFDYEAIDVPAAELLVDEGNSADLVVVGSSGAGPVKSFLLGSVTAAVLRQCPCPVAVVPTKLRKPSGRIVVGCDGSEASNRAIRWAADEAERLGVELVVLHAWVYPYRFTAEGLARGSDIAQVDAAIALEQAVELARDRITGVVSTKLVEEGAAQALLEASDVADLVVVGSRGRGGFRSMVLGSVALAVTANASCPVVVVR